MLGWWRTGQREPQGRSWGRAAGTWASSWKGSGGDIWLSRRTRGCCWVSGEAGEAWPPGRRSPRGASKEDFPREEEREGPGEDPSPLLRKRVRPDRVGSGLCLGVLGTAWSWGSTGSGRMKISCGLRCWMEPGPGLLAGVNHPPTPAESTLLPGFAAISAELLVFFLDVNRK